MSTDAVSVCDQWICENCTLSNPLSATICETCSRARKVNDSSTNHNPIASNNSNSKSCVETTIVWEWKGGGEWHEYPDDISAQIDEAYFKGNVRFDIDVPYGDY